jgi:hypothetical protein
VFPDAHHPIAPPYIELIYTFYRLFSWGMRQIAGYMEDYWKTLGLDIPVPSYGHLSDLFSKLDITVKQRCKRLARRLANGEDVTVIIDSTGLSFDRASQWYEEKYVCATRCRLFNCLIDLKRRKETCCSVNSSLSAHALPVTVRCEAAETM